MAEVQGGAAPTTAEETTGAKVVRKVKELNLPNRIHTWPYLVRLEFLCAVIVMVVVTVWSLVLRARM